MFLDNGEIFILPRQCVKIEVQETLSIQTLY